MELGFNQPIRWSTCSEEQQNTLLMRPAIAASGNISAAVSQIIDHVRQEGDIALKVLSQRFDKTAISSVRISPNAVEEAQARLGDDIKTAMKTAIANIRRFHEAQKPEPITVETQAGVVCQQVTRPIDSVGLYIPGGSAPLLSTVMMLGTPANIAGCRKIILCSPHRLQMKSYMPLSCVVSPIFSKSAEPKPLQQWHLVQKVFLVLTKFLVREMPM
ncbi:histidinol dehydrogenase [Providencia rustigianii]